MIRDPLAEWDGPYPYDELADIGVTPDYTHKAMGEVTFTLMTQSKLSGRARQAWHELNDLQNRLLIDFLLYDVDLVGEIQAARGRTAPEPVELDEPPRLAGATELPREMLTGLADEFRATTSLDELLPIRVLQDVDMYPPLSVIDGLLRFDK
ncbi:hypothetical protein GCM10009839_49970 [Catenulispora yoronensis]|uniref:Uncharacterized protein n=1 Tax=Catenulispora yoronensis TaxID=450799 RepID=A0ABN2UQE6_9ACTN